MGSVGLKTHIWNNNMLSGLMLFSLPSSLFFVVWSTVYVMVELNKGAVLAKGLVNAKRDYFGQGFFRQLNELLASQTLFTDSFFVAMQFMPYVLVVVGLWYMVAWALNGEIMRGLTGAMPVTRASRKGLYNLLETLCIGRGMTMPKICILRSPALNAFASGVDQHSYMITVTTGLMENLSKDEMEAVLAHELTHIENNDVRLMAVISIFAGMFSVLAGLVFKLLFFRGTDVDAGMHSPLGFGRLGVFFLVVLGDCQYCFCGHLAGQNGHIETARICRRCGGH